MVHALALLLLWTDMPVPPGLDSIPGLVDALRAEAVREEWLGPNEKVMECDEGPEREATVSEWVRQLRYLRNWLAGTPFLRDCPALPGPDVTTGQVRFARAHLAEIRSRRLFCTPDLRDHYDDWIAEAEDLLETWTLLEEVSNPVWRVVWRRVALDRLASKIGRDNLECGNLPPAVPLWRFRRVP